MLAFGRNLTGSRMANYAARQLALMDLDLLLVQDPDGTVVSSIQSMGFLTCGPQPTSRAYTAQTSTAGSVLFLGGLSCTRA